jgi:hypothetical protein
VALAVEGLGLAAGGHDRDAPDGGVAGHGGEDVVVANGAEEDVCEKINTVFVTLMVSTLI